MLKMSMRKKLLIIFVLLFTIPIVVALLILNQYASQFSRYSTEMLNIRSMQETGSAINQLFGNIYDFSLYLGLNQDMRQFLTVPLGELYTQNYSYAAQSVLSTMSYSNRYIKSMSVFGMDSRVISSGSRILSMTQEERARTTALNGASCWSIQPDIDGNPHIYLLRMIRLPERLEQRLGFIKIELNADEFTRIFAPAGDAASTFRDVYYIVDDLGHPFYAYPPVKNQQAEQALAQMVTDGQTGGTHYIGELGLYATPFLLSNPQWLICRVSSNDYSVSITSTLQKTLFTSMLLCFVFCLLLSSIFSAAILSPLRKLGTLMQQLEQEQFDVRFRPRGNDEISVLAGQFDRMSDRLQELYNDVYLGQLRLKDARLAVLQAQINPHFLYNTLDTIYWMSEFNHTGDVSNMVSALSQLFRLSLSGDENDMVPLETELDHIRCYLYIQQIRHAENLSFTITSRAENQRPVLKLILQPLVENAILHGIDQVGQGVLQISVEENEGCMLYRISDSAGLADPASVRELLDAPREGFSAESGRRRSIGLRNIQDRIQLRYGDTYGICCERLEGCTVFTVRLPLFDDKEAGK